MAAAPSPSSNVVDLAGTTEEGELDSSPRKQEQGELSLSSPSCCAEDKHAPLLKPFNANARVDKRRCSPALCTCWLGASYRYTAVPGCKRPTLHRQACVWGPSRTVWDPLFIDMRTSVLGVQRPLVRLCLRLHRRGRSGT